MLWLCLYNSGSNEMKFINITAVFLLLKTLVLILACQTDTYDNYYMVQ